MEGEKTGSNFRVEGKVEVNLTYFHTKLNLKKVFYYNEFRKGRTFKYSEDCLFLNIFTP